MDNEDDENDQEIGHQGKKEDAAAEEETKVAATEGTTAEGGEGRPQRKRKDYGDKYDPNYKKKQWLKGQQQNKQPAIVREKNERGDYVVTSLSIPDRVPTKQDKVRQLHTRLSWTH